MYQWTLELSPAGLQPVDEQKSTSVLPKDGSPSGREARPHRGSTAGGWCVAADGVLVKGAPVCMGHTVALCYPAVG